MTDRQATRRSRTMLAAALAVTLGLPLALGWWVGDQRAVVRDAEMRERLLRQALQVACVINPELAAKLTFTAADQGTPAFEVIREQMILLGKTFPQRGIYSMALRGGTIFFGPENYPENDSMASPPGTEYGQPSVENLEIFRDKRPFTEGPISDEFGTFVSAMAPVLDPRSGNVIMVVGADVLAGDWKAQVNAARRGPLLAALGVFLLLLAGAVSVRWRNQQRRAVDLKLRAWIVAPVALALMIVMGAFISYEDQKVREESRNDIRQTLDRVEGAWKSAIFSKTQMLGAQLGFIAIDSALRTAWQGRDLETLTALSRPVLAELKAQFGITHFSFVAPDRTCFLRVHQPERRGDLIHRTTMLTAVRTGEDARGTELGALGAPTLRYVRPWKQEGKTIGYLELGMEVKNLAATLVRDLNVDIVSLVPKEYTSKEEFKAGKQALGLSGEWDDFPDLVVASQSLPALPDELVLRLKDGHAHLAADDMFRVRQGGRTFDCGAIHLLDAAGHEATDLIVLQDVTKAVATLSAARALNLGLVFMLLVGVIALLWSITGRAETQLAGAFATMREGEVRFDQLAEQSGTIAWEVDARGLYTYLSHVVEAVLGYRPDELVGRMHFYDLHPESGRETFKEAAFAVFERKEPFQDLENATQAKDGRVVWVSTNGMPMLNADGTLRGYRGSDRDITERRRAEEELRKLASVVRYSSELVNLATLDGKMIFLNEAGSGMLGISPAEVEQFNIMQVIPAHLKEKVETELLPAAMGVGTWEGDLQYLNCKTGQITDVHAMVFVIRDVATGAPLYLANVSLDITERRRAEEALLETNRDLEEATARAKQASQAKSEFLANMSHEIRTPMNGVIGMTGLLLDTQLSAEQRQFAEIVRTSGEALLVLINDILDFSKIEARKLELEMLDFELRMTLEDVAELLAVKAREKGLEVVCLADPELPALLRGDPGRLRQVLLNLGGNAVKFTRQGGVMIRASVAAEDEQRVTVRFAVTDTGIGIPRDRQGALFSPFTQVDGSTTRKYGGTGLGLAISRQLAELMGGAVGLESEENQGSTFWFTAVLEKPPAGQLAAPAPLGDLAGVRVLVVDDLDTNALLVTTLLKGWGCRFATAADGEAALDRLREAVREGDPYGAALLDKLMPGMDGVELGRRIKESPEIRDTRLIMMTSHGERGDAARVTQVGFAGYLAKPLRQSQLRECLALVLGRGDSPMAAPGPGLVTRHTVAESRRHRVRILVAEDNVTNQIVALKILERLGYRADVAANGREALAALRDIPYDLVLMDCQMPELDGFEATREIRDPKSSVRDHGVPIIAMTAHTMKGDREKCLAAGMDDYLGKPVRPAELAAALDRWLATRGGSAAAGADRAAPAGPEEPETAAPVFDHAAFLERVMGDEELVREITEMFLADLPVQLEELAAAVSSGDCLLAGQLAHGVKGASANVGGEALREMAFELEKAGKAGDLSALKTLLPRTQERFARLKEAMEVASRLIG